MIIVTATENPDLDGTACAIGYSELLNKLNKNAKAIYFGTLGLEVEFVKNYTNYFPVEKHEGKYGPDDKFVIVDSTDSSGIDHPENVIEIFDHRQLVSTEKFVNSKNKIELVGSCATLITEEFQKINQTPSINAAIYLYSAIISNTINFKNLVTTDRDKKAANWLMTFVTLPEDYVKQMFSSKSNIDPNQLYENLLQDFAVRTFGDKDVGISQIEITDLEKQIKEWGNRLIDVLTQFKKENNLDYVFFTGIDIFEAFNIFYTIDEESRKLFSKALEISDLKPGYKTKEIIMRKQIWPKVEKALQSF